MSAWRPRSPGYVRVGRRREGDALCASLLCQANESSRPGVDRDGPDVQNAVCHGLTSAFPPRRRTSPPFRHIRWHTAGPHCGQSDGARPVTDEARAGPRETRKAPGSLAVDPSALLSVPPARLASRSCRSSPTADSHQWGGATSREPCIFEEPAPPGPQSHRVRICRPRPAAASVSPRGGWPSQEGLP